MTDHDFALFMQMTSALSPENLHCDGEISRSAARRKERIIRSNWTALEERIGRTVTEDEVWAEFTQRRRTGQPDGVQR